MSHPNWDAQVALKLIREHQLLPGALLPILHALQTEFGYVDDKAIPVIAEVLNLSKAEVHGVITFYHDFRRYPPGRHILRLCRAESCQAMGCERVIDHVERRLKVKLGQTTTDRAFTIEPVYCLGNCALSPAAMLDGELFGRVSSEVIDYLIDDARRHA